MSLAGADRLTISPNVLNQLSSTTVSESSEIDSIESLHANKGNDILLEKRSFGNDEAGFRMALTRNSGGVNEAKMTQVRCAPLENRLQTQADAFTSPGYQYLLRHAA